LDFGLVGKAASPAQDTGSWSRASSVAASAEFTDFRGRPLMAVRTHTKLQWTASARLQLPIVICRVEMSFGFGNQAIIANSPFLVSADTHPFDRGENRKVRKMKGRSPHSGYTKQPCIGSRKHSA